jgi:predicted RNA-binding protein with RPS1 domain
MAPPYHDHGGGKSDQPPPIGSIERGEVMRIEDYGAFVQLERYRGMRGLVHISQIASTRLEAVTDAVSVQDTVWVKVLEVSEEASPDGRPRHKIRLSMKDASQDGSAQDLGAISEAREQASHALESNLNSTIGMGVARDPMAGYSSGSRLVMKHEKKDALVINGYALVDDTEGELPEPAPAPVNVNVNLNVNVAPMAAPKAPMGRGRGTTLPAWMTNQGSTDEPGPIKGSDKHGSDDDSSVSGRRGHRKKKDKSKRKDRKKHSSRKHDDRDRHRESSKRSSKRSKRHYSEDEEEERRHARKRKSHRRSRSSSSEEDSTKDQDRAGRRRHDNRDKQSDESGRERDRSRPRKNRDQYSDASDDGIQFQSVEEAKKLIEEIDAKRRESRDEKRIS